MAEDSTHDFIGAPPGDDIEVFITTDKAVLMGGILHPIDEDMIRGRRVASPEQALGLAKGDWQGRHPGETLPAGWVELTPAMVKEMRQEARETLAAFDAIMVRLVNPTMAKTIRIFRVDRNWSWRFIAGFVNYLQSRDRWSPPANQLAGMALCKRAAELLGEDYMEPPWN